jgi:peptide deformylase
MTMEIVKYGDPVLENRSKDVTEFDDTLRELVDEMFETMYAAHGVGLAAPQVGVGLRLFVMDCSNEDRTAQKIVLANPEILEATGGAEGSEGCLSIPGLYSELARPAKVRVRGQLTDGSWAEYEFEGLEARCVAHECDHLAGTLFIDRLGPVKRDLMRRKIKKRKKAGDW